MSAISSFKFELLYIEVLKRKTTIFQAINEHILMWEIKIFCQSAYITLLDVNILPIQSWL